MEVDEEENQGLALSAVAEDLQPGSSATIKRVAAAKKFIENHYKSQSKTFQDCNPVQNIGGITVAKLADGCPRSIGVIPLPVHQDTYLGLIHLVKSCKDLMTCSMA